MSSQESRRVTYLARDETPTFPWRKWTVAVRRPDETAGYLLSLRGSAVPAALRSRLTAHVAVQSANLQPLELQQSGDQLVVFSAMPAGATLSDRWLGRTFSPLQVCQLGIAIADSLAVLHEHALVHGSVRGDRVWVGQQGRVLLLRDPAADPERQGRAGEQDWLQTRDSPGEYAAPEFALAQQRPAPETDLYALGCLLFRALTGRPAAEGETWDQAILEHTETMPPELAAAAKAQETGDPLLRVIAFAMAKNPQARFESATKLAAALRAILPVVDQVGGQAAASKAEPPAAVPAESPAGVPAESPAGVPAESPAAVPAESPAAVPAEAPMKAPTVVPAAPQSAAKQLAGLRTEPSAAIRSRRDQHRRSRRPISVLLTLGGLTVGLLVVLAVLIARARQEPPVAATETPTTATPATDTPPAPVAVTNPTADVVAQESPSEYQLVDDHRLLYLPPYPADSPLPPLQLLPPGPAILVALRPAFLIDDSAGPSLQHWFQPELAGWIDSLQSRTAVSLEQLEQLVIAIHPGSGDVLETSLAVALRQPVDISSITDSLAISEARTADGEPFYAGDDDQADALYFPVDQYQANAVSRYVVGPLRRVREVAESKGAEIVLPRSLQMLWDQSSGEADLVALFTPNFLFADGRMILEQSIPEVIESARRFLMPDVTAALLTARFDDELAYLEARCVPGGQSSEARLVQQMQDAVQSWPTWADQFLIEASPDPSWRLLASRLPLMMRFAAEQTRFGVDRRAAVANLYLPRRVVPQLALGISLALNTPAGNPAATVAATPQPLTLKQLLNREMSVSFDQESLEFAVQTVVNQFQANLPAGSELPAVRILGTDLEKRGITQNQQIRGFVQTNVPLRDVLTALVVKANPDQTAAGPADPNQVLVWAVADNPEKPGTKLILITTRDAAEGKYQMPPEFRADR